jgi:plastocyanin
MGGAEDHTADQNVTVHFGPSLMYTPKCILIAAGSSVTWQADQTTPATTFFNHPLEPGELQGTTVIPEPNNPIVATASMTDSVTFTFPDPGTFGYFCGVHGMEFGMEGAVFVQ